MEEAPVVTLTLSGGRTVTCTTERYPDLDRPQGDPRGQVTYYRVTPDEDVTLGTYEVHAEVVPPHTAFFVDVPLAGLETIRPEGDQL